LAYHYINRFRNAEPENARKHTFWFEAGTEARLRKSVLGLARTIGVMVSEWQDPLIVMRDWLSSRDNGPWIAVIDGLDRIAIAKRVKSLLDDTIGNVLVTTKNREILDELDIWQERSYVRVGNLELEACRNLFRSINKDILADPSQMDEFLRMYQIPRKLKLVASYLQKKRIPTLTWYETSKLNNGFEGKEDQEYSIFALLVYPSLLTSGINPHESSYPLLRPLGKLLVELTCFNKDEIDIVLLQQEYEKTRLQSMMDRLGNCTFINRGSGRYSQHYYLHESVQTDVRAWISKLPDGPHTLLQAHERVLCMLLSRYQQERKHKKHAGRSSHLLKLPFMPHFERFLHFIQDCKNDDAFLARDCSKNMVQSVITFMQVYLDEGRYDDAACIMNFTRKLYTNGVDFKLEAQLARHFAKPYIMKHEALEQPQDDDWQQAAAYLQDVVHKLHRSEDQPERWQCVLELIELFCTYGRPEEAAESLQSLHEVRLVRNWLYVGELRVWQQVQQAPQDQDLKKKSAIFTFAILKKIAEGKVHFARATLPTFSGSRKKELKRARTAFEDAREAIDSWTEPGSESWKSGVDQKIADVFCEFGNEESALKALAIYQRILKPLQTDSDEPRQAQVQKRKWGINCQIARAQLQLDHNSKVKATELLQETVALYGNYYGKHSEHTRACAKLLKEAYAQIGEHPKAEEIGKNYRLEPRGIKFKNLDLIVGNGFLGLVMSRMLFLVLMFIVVCLWTYPHVNGRTA
jgi:hypothetical protein